jgi:hypothetical protein
MSDSRRSPDRLTRPASSFKARIWRSQGKGQAGRTARYPAKWRGVRRATPNPSFWSIRPRFLHAKRKSTSLENALEHQPACKPGSVGHRPLARTIRDGHSSGATFARCLEQPTRTASLTSLPRRYRLREQPALPSLFGLAPGVVCHAGSVAGPAVRSYRTFSPLLPVPFGVGKRFVLCGTVPGVAPAGCYPAPHVDGARTFLPRSLSAIAGAAVRPTDPSRHGGWEGPRQADKRRADAENKLS